MNTKKKRTPTRVLANPNIILVQPRIPVEAVRFQTDKDVPALNRLAAKAEQMNVAHNVRFYPVQLSSLGRSGISVEAEDPRGPRGGWYACLLQPGDWLILDPRARRGLEVVRDEAFRQEFAPVEISKQAYSFVWSRGESQTDRCIVCAFQHLYPNCPESCACKNGYYITTPPTEEKPA